MCFKNNPGCRCCGQAWFATESPNGNHQSLAHRKQHEFYLRSTEESGVPTKPLYGAFGDEPLIYQEILGIGPSPVRVGFTSKGGVILRDTGGNFWKCDHYGKGLTAFWDSPSASTRFNQYVGNEPGHAYYVEEWDVAFVPFGSEWFISDGAGQFIRRVYDPGSSFSSSTPFCIDKDGNFYTIDGGHTKRNAAIIAPAPPIGFAMNHDGNDLWAFTSRTARRLQGASWVQVGPDLGDLWDAPPTSPEGTTGPVSLVSGNVQNYYFPSRKRFYHTNGLGFGGPLVTVSANVRLLRTLLEVKGATGQVIEWQ